MNNNDPFTNTVRDAVDRFNYVVDGKDPVLEKIACLKQIITELTGMATACINAARSDYNLLDSAILRTEYIIDVLDDDGYSASPNLIQDGLLDCFSDAVVNMWRPLSIFRDREVAFLRLSLETMIELETHALEDFDRRQQEAAAAKPDGSARTMLPRPHLIHSN